MTKNHPNIPKKTAVLCVNLGTPSQPNFWGVRRFLKEFLWDKRVVDTPRWLWWWILNGIILTVRPGKVAKQYQHIWLEGGSPLLVHSQNLVSSLQKTLGDEHDVLLAMRYGEPSLKSALETISSDHYQKIMVVPLFPHYSSSTTASIFDMVARHFMKKSFIPEMHFINHYADHPDYIEALAHSIETHWSKKGKGEHLVISYHGIPMRYFKRGDPYYCFCSKTTRLLAERLQLSETEWTMVFQSRFGPGQWLEPSCEEKIESLAKAGVQSLDIISPGFSADCLETLEELDESYHEVFIENGGKAYHYIPALNDQEQHIACLKSIIQAHSSSSV